MNLPPILRHVQALRTFSKGHAQALSIAFVLVTTILYGDESGASSSNRETPTAVAYLKPSLATAEREQGHSKLPTYELTIGQKDLAAMERTAYSNATHPATF